MPPPLQRFGGALNNLASHYQQYPAHSQAQHSAGLPPPSLASNPSFMNSNSMSNPFAVNGNALSLSGGFGNAGLGMPGGTGLASQAAQMSFAGAGIHQQHNGMGEPQTRMGGVKHRIKDVWANNLHEEMAIIRQLANDYPYIATNTVFPGVVARPMGSFNGKSDYHYQCMRCNVDLLKMFQLGITLFNEDGETLPASLPAAELAVDSSRDIPKQYANALVPIPTTWQFHFKFSMKDDMYSEQSIQSSRIAGIDVDRLEAEGIEPLEFSCLLLTSGLVCDEDLHWLTCHGAYDLGHLTKLLSVLPLPDDEQVFDKLMTKYFPSIYDVKFVVREGIRRHQLGQLTPQDPTTADLLAKLDMKTGLETFAEIFKVKRIGPMHQAGSNSLLTGKVFFKVRERIFGGDIDDEISGKMWGIGAFSGGAGAADKQPQGTPQHYNQENLPMGANGYVNGGTPSTPNTSNAGMVHTPGHNSNGGGGGGALGPMTPGGVGGVFGSFQYSNK